MNVEQGEEIVEDASDVLVRWSRQRLVWAGLHGNMKICFI